jgi:hypothetical protein
MYEKSVDGKVSEEYLSDASEDVWKPSAGVLPGIDLPVAFKIYNRKKITATEFYIAVERNRPLNFISGNPNYITKYAEMKLHQGPSTDSPLLGSTLIRNTTIEVNLRSAVHILKEADVSFWKKLKSSGTEYYFHIHTQHGTERFEWQRSKGPEVASLQGRGNHGWLLLRDGHGEHRDEPVAVYAVDAMSLKLAGHFAFLNSGLSGKLGADFALIAILSALSLGYKRREAYVNGAVLINARGD